MTHEIDEKRRDDQSPAHVPGVCVTRRLFMNSVVSLPIVAAIPTTAPAMPPADSQLLELASQYQKVQARWSVLNDQAAELELVQYVGRYAAMRRSTAYRKIDREYKKLLPEMRQLEQQIVALRATTLKGTLAKIRCLEAFNNGLLMIEEEEASGRFALSVLEDLLAKEAA